MYKPNTNLKHLLERLKIVLFRDIRALLKASKGGAALNKDQSQSLVNYIKVLTTLINNDVGELEKMSDDDLKKLIKK